MPRSRRDPKRKKQLQEYKTVKQIEKHIKIMNQPEQSVPQVRNLPIWKSTDLIEMNGLEFEAISNFVNAANAAVNSIMNRNLLNGTVKLTFEKLNADGTAYVPMTDAEQAPYQEELANLIEARRQQEKQATSPQPEVQIESETLPQTPFGPTSEEAVDASPTVSVES